MYKLICCNLTRSNRSLTNFTKTYKQVAQNFENHIPIYSSRKRFGSETDLRNIAEDVEVPETVAEAARDAGVAATTSKSYTSFFTKKMGIKCASSSLLCDDMYSQNTQFSMCSPKSAKLLHSFYTGDEKTHPAPNKKKLFKDKAAMDLYKNAIEECIKIRGKKFMPDKDVKKANWEAAQPIKAATWEDKSETKLKPEMAEPKLTVNKFKMKPHFVYVYPEERHKDVDKKEIPVKKKISPHVVNEKHHQLIRKKFKITYPTHVIKYRLSLNKPSKIEQQRSPIRSSSAKKDINLYNRQQNEVKQAKYPAVQNPHMREAADGTKARFKEATEREEAEWQNIIKQHPVVEKASNKAKMAMNKMYNKLLYVQRLKQSKKEEKQKSDPKDEAKENRNMKFPPQKEKRDFPVEAASSVTDEMIREPHVMQHPAVSKQAFTSAVKYPKRVYVERDNSYDIEKICIKPNENSARHDDYVVETSPKASPEKEPYLLKKLFVRPTQVETEKKPQVQKENKKNEEIRLVKDALERNRLEEDSQEDAGQYLKPNSSKESFKEEAEQSVIPADKPESLMEEPKRLHNWPAESITEVEQSRASAECFTKEEPRLKTTNKIEQVELFIEPKIPEENLKEETELKQRDLTENFKKETDYSLNSKGPVESIREDMKQETPAESLKKDAEEFVELNLQRGVKHALKLKNPMVTHKEEVEQPLKPKGAAESLANYVKKLKQLKDWTAMDRTNVEKPAVSEMVKKLHPANINFNKQEVKPHTKMEDTKKSEGKPTIKITTLADPTKKQHTSLEKCSKQNQDKLKNEDETAKQTGRDQLGETKSEELKTSSIKKPIKFLKATNSKTIKPDLRVKKRTSMKPIYSPINLAKSKDALKRMQKEGTPKRDTPRHQTPPKKVAKLRKLKHEIVVESKDKNDEIEELKKIVKRKKKLEHLKKIMSQYQVQQVDVSDVQIEIDNIKKELATKQVAIIRITRKKKRDKQKLNKYIVAPKQNKKEEEMPEEHDRSLIELIGLQQKKRTNAKNEFEDSSASIQDKELDKIKEDTVQQKTMKIRSRSEDRTEKFFDKKKTARERSTASFPERKKAEDKIRRIIEAEQISMERKVGHQEEENTTTEEAEEFLPRRKFKKGKSPTVEEKKRKLRELSSKITETGGKRMKKGKKKKHILFHATKTLVDPVKPQKEPSFKTPEEGKYKLEEDASVNEPSIKAEEAEPQDGAKDPQEKELFEQNIKFEEHLSDRFRLQDNYEQLKEAGRHITEPLSEDTEPKYGLDEKKGNNRPSIRRDKPPEPEPKEKTKKEKPKTKKDMVLPSKGQNDPQMRKTNLDKQAKSKQLENLMGGSNENILYSAQDKYGIVSLERFKRCKSLSELAEEQKAIMLNEINEKLAHKPNSHFHKGESLAKAKEEVKATAKQPHSKETSERVYDDASSISKNDRKAEAKDLTSKVHTKQSAPEEKDEDMSPTSTSRKDASRKSISDTQVLRGFPLLRGNKHRTGEETDTKVKSKQTINNEVSKKNSLTSKNTVQAAEDLNRKVDIKQPVVDKSRPTSTSQIAAKLTTSKHENTQSVKDDNEAAFRTEKNDTKATANDSISKDAIKKSVSQPEVKYRTSKAKAASKQTISEDQNKQPIKGHKHEEASPTRGVKSREKVSLTSKNIVKPDIYDVICKVDTKQSVKEEEQEPADKAELAVKQKISETESKRSAEVDKHKQVYPIRGVKSHGKNNIKAKTDDLIRKIDIKQSVTEKSHPSSTSQLTAKPTSSKDETTRSGKDTEPASLTGKNDTKGTKFFIVLHGYKRPAAELTKAKVESKQSIKDDANEKMSLTSENNIHVTTIDLIPADAIKQSEEKHDLASKVASKQAITEDANKKSVKGDKHEQVSPTKGVKSHDLIHKVGIKQSITEKPHLTSTSQIAAKQRGSKDEITRLGKNNSEAASRSTEKNDTKETKGFIVLHGFKRPSAEQMKTKEPIKDEKMSLISKNNTEATEIDSIFTDALQQPVSQSEEKYDTTSKAEVAAKQKISDSEIKRSAEVDKHKEASLIRGMKSHDKIILPSETNIKAKTDNWICEADTKQSEKEEKHQPTDKAEDKPSVEDRKAASTRKDNVQVAVEQTKEKALLLIEGDGSEAMSPTRNAAKQADATKGNRYETALPKKKANPPASAKDKYKRQTKGDTILPARKTSLHVPVKQASPKEKSRRGIKADKGKTILPTSKNNPLKTPKQQETKSIKGETHRKNSYASIHCPQTAPKQVNVKDKSKPPTSSDRYRKNSRATKNYVWAEKWKTKPALPTKIKKDKRLPLSEHTEFPNLNKQHGKESGFDKEVEQTGNKSGPEPSHGEGIKSVKMDIDSLPTHGTENEFVKKGSQVRDGPKPLKSRAASLPTDEKEMNKIKPERSPEPSKSSGIKQFSDDIFRKSRRGRFEDDVGFSRTEYKPTRSPFTDTKEIKATKSEWLEGTSTDISEIITPFADKIFRKTRRARFEDDTVTSETKNYPTRPWVADAKEIRTEKSAGSLQVPNNSAEIIPQFSDKIFRKTRRGRFEDDVPFSETEMKLRGSQITDAKDITEVKSEWSVRVPSEGSGEMITQYSDKIFRKTKRARFEDDVAISEMASKPRNFQDTVAEKINATKSERMVKVPVESNKKITQFSDLFRKSKRGRFEDDDTFSEVKNKSTRSQVAATKEIKVITSERLVKVLAERSEKPTQFSDNIFRKSKKGRFEDDVGFSRPEYKPTRSQIRDAKAINAIKSELAMDSPPTGGEIIIKEFPDDLCKKYGEARNDYGRFEEGRFEDDAYSGIKNKPTKYQLAGAKENKAKKPVSSAEVPTESSKTLNPKSQITDAQDTKVMKELLMGPPAKNTETITQFSNIVFRKSQRGRFEDDVISKTENKPTRFQVTNVKEIKANKSEWPAGIPSESRKILTPQSQIKHAKDIKTTKSDSSMEAQTKNSKITQFSNNIFRKSKRGRFEDDVISGIENRSKRSQVTDAKEVRAKKSEWSAGVPADSSEISRQYSEKSSRKTKRDIIKKKLEQQKNYAEQGKSEQTAFTSGKAHKIEEISNASNAPRYGSKLSTQNTIEEKPKQPTEYQILVKNCIRQSSIPVRRPSTVHETVRRAKPDDDVKSKPKKPIELVQNAKKIFVGERTERKDLPALKREHTKIPIATPRVERPDNAVFLKEEMKRAKTETDLEGDKNLKINKPVSPERWQKIDTKQDERRGNRSHDGKEQNRTTVVLSNQGDTKANKKYIALGLPKNKGDLEKKPTNVASAKEAQKPGEADSRGLKQITKLDTYRDASTETNQKKMKTTRLKKTSNINITRTTDKLLNIVDNNCGIELSKSLPVLATKKKSAHHKDKPGKKNKVIVRPNRDYKKLISNSYVSKPKDIPKSCSKLSIIRLGEALVAKLTIDGLSSATKSIYGLRPSTDVGISISKTQKRPTLGIYMHKKPHRIGSVKIINIKDNASANAESTKKGKVTQISSLLPKQHQMKRENVKFSTTRSKIMIKIAANTWTLQENGNMSSKRVTTVHKSRPVTSKSRKDDAGKGSTIVSQETKKIYIHGNIGEYAKKMFEDHAQMQKKLPKSDLSKKGEPKKSLKGKSQESPKNDSNISEKPKEAQWKKFHDAPEIKKPRPSNHFEAAISTVCISDMKLNKTANGRPRKTVNRNQLIKTTSLSNKSLRKMKASRQKIQIPIKSKYVLQNYTSIPTNHKLPSIPTKTRPAQRNEQIEIKLMNKRRRRQSQSKDKLTCLKPNTVLSSSTASNEKPVEKNQRLSFAQMKLVNKPGRGLLQWQNMLMKKITATTSPYLTQYYVPTKKGAKNVQVASEKGHMRHPLEVIMDKGHKRHPLEVLMDKGQKRHPLEVTMDKGHKSYPLEVIMERKETVKPTNENRDCFEKRTSRSDTSLHRKGSLEGDLRTSFYKYLMDNQLAREFSKYLVEQRYNLANWPAHSAHPSNDTLAYTVGSDKETSTSPSPLNSKTFNIGEKAAQHVETKVKTNDVNRAKKMNPILSAVNKEVEGWEYKKADHQEKAQALPSLDHRYFTRHEKAAHHDTNDIEKTNFTSSDNPKNVKRTRHKTGVKEVEGFTWKEPIIRAVAPLDAKYYLISEKAPSQEKTDDIKSIEKMNLKSTEDPKTSAFIDKQHSEKTQDEIYKEVKNSKYKELHNPKTAPLNSKYQEGKTNDINDTEEFLPTPTEDLVSTGKENLEKTQDETVVNKEVRDSKYKKPNYQIIPQASASLDSNYFTRIEKAVLQDGNNNDMKDIDKMISSPSEDLKSSVPIGKQNSKKTQDESKENLEKTQDETVVNKEVRDSKYKKPNYQIIAQASASLDSNYFTRIEKAVLQDGNNNDIDKMISSPSEDLKSSVPIGKQNSKKTQDETAVNKEAKNSKYQEPDYHETPKALAPFESDKFIRSEKPVLQERKTTDTNNIERLNSIHSEVPRSSVNKDVEGLKYKERSNQETTQVPTRSDSKYLITRDKAPQKLETEDKTTDLNDVTKMSPTRSEDSISFVPISKQNPEKPQDEAAVSNEVKDSKYEEAAKALDSKCLMRREKAAPHDAKTNGINDIKTNFRPSDNSKSFVSTGKQNSERTQDQIRVNKEVKGSKCKELGFKEIIRALAPLDSRYFLTSEEVALHEGKTNDIEKTNQTSSKDPKISIGKQNSEKMRDEMAVDEEVEGLTYKEKTIILNDDKKMHATPSEDSISSISGDIQNPKKAQSKQVTGSTLAKVATMILTCPPNFFARFVNNHNDKNVIMAQINEVFKENYKTEKICKFNKNLLKHIKSDSEIWTPYSKEPELFTNLYVTDVINKDTKTISELCSAGKNIRRPAHAQTKPVELTNKERTPSKDRLKGSSNKLHPVVIEKTIPNRYKVEKPPEPKQAVWGCNKICLPLKKLSEVALNQPIDLATTLNKPFDDRYYNVPKTPTKYKKIKITHIVMKRPRRTLHEHFFQSPPKAKKHKKEKGGKQELRDLQLEAEKAHIMELRFEIMRKLHKQFRSMYGPNVNKVKGNFEAASKHYEQVVKNDKKMTEEHLKQGSLPKRETDLYKIDTKQKPSFNNVSVYYSKILDIDQDSKKKIRNVNVDLDSTKVIKNNTEMLIKKLALQDTRIDKKEKKETSPALEEADTDDKDKPPNEEEPKK